jgi:hypothetical protein
VKCLENIIQELNDQPIQQLESTIDDQTQNEEIVAPVLSKSGLYNKQCDKLNLTLYSRNPSKKYLRIQSVPQRKHNTSS